MWALLRADGRSFPIDPMFQGQICGFMITDRIKGPRGEGIKARVIGIIKEEHMMAEFLIPTLPWTPSSMVMSICAVKKRPGASLCSTAQRIVIKPIATYKIISPPQARFDYASCCDSFTACFPASWNCTKAPQAFPPKALSLAKSEPCFQS